MHLRSVAAAVIATGLLAGCGGGGTTVVTVTAPAPEASSSSPGITLEQIAELCRVASTRYAEIGDGGSTITLDGEGDEDAGGLTVEQIFCVLGASGIPDSVVSDIEATRALDGRQDASWDGYSAAWRYHPDDGLEVILTQE